MYIRVRESEYVSEREGEDEHDERKKVNFRMCRPHEDIDCRYC